MVRIGTCSWADEGLVKNWYPRGVSSPAARLAYYAERFDTVEVDSPFYRLPSPETTAKWAERTPDDFTWHAKASAEMTGHEEADRETAFREFREAFAPLEASGKLRGVLLQYHPRVVKSREAKEEIAAAGPLLAPLAAARRVPPPLLARGGRAGGHVRVPGGARARLRLGRLAAHAGVERPAPRRRRDGARRLRPLPRPQLADVEHPRRAVVGRPVRLDVLEGGARGVGRAAAEAHRARPRRCTC